MEESLRILHSGAPLANNTSDTSPSSASRLEVQLVGESLLYSVFRKGSKFTNHMAVKLESMLFSALKNYDSGTYSNSPGGAIILTIDVAVEMFAQMATTYNQLLVGVVPPDEHAKYFLSPEAFCKERASEISDYIRRKLTLLTLAHSNSWNLSKAMTKLIRTAAAADIENGRVF